MDNGIQAISARIAKVEQRFVDDGDPASVDASGGGLSSSAFASVLAAALGTTALGIDGGADSSGSSAMDSAALGLGTSGAGATGVGGTGSTTSGLGSGLLGTGSLGSALLGSGLQGGAGSAALGVNQQLTASVLISLLTAVARGGGVANTSASSGATGAAAGAVGAVGGRTPANRLSPGAYPKLTPPAELAAYGNGRIPAERLQSIGVGSHKLYAPAATAYRQMTADAASQGVTIGITDSYRSYDSQVELAGRKGLYSQGGLAATPGTSNHGWGLAVDLDLDATAQQWMRDNAHKYGFVEDTPREPWHWGYRPASSV